MFNFYEFFAGGGMAKAGLGSDWQCLFANDSDPIKVATYISNWGEGTISTKDVGDVSLADLKGQADLIWASFPCQDLSLAGNGAGLAGSKSGAFWKFWRIVQQLNEIGQAPKIIALENVMGTVTSHGGRDFQALCNALVAEGYRLGALCLDAAHFLPQSRKRLFIIGVKSALRIPDEIVSGAPVAFSTTQSIIAAHSRLSENATKLWVWWKACEPNVIRPDLMSVLVEESEAGPWHPIEKTQYLLSLMDDNNKAKVVEVMTAGQPSVGTIYKRMRPSKGVRNVQRAEVRFDGVAGCLRVPIGGSSMQTLLFVHGKEVKSRTLSPRESARLMGLGDDYVLPSNDRQAYHLTGDGVAVPVVSYLRDMIFEPLLNANLDERVEISSTVESHSVDQRAPMEIAAQ